MYVYMVQYCPENYTNHDVKSNCEQIHRTTYLQNIPVQSHVTNQVYANLFCAICHADLNLTTTKASIECNNEDLLENCDIDPFKDILLPKFHHPNTLTWTRLLGQFGVHPLNSCSKSHHYSLTCRLNLLLKEDPKPYRPCHHDNIEVIDYCPHLEKNFCNLYYLTVYHQGRFYSNPHCAQCHGISLNATTCAQRGK